MITIAGKQYEVSPLRCKHLKELSKTTGQGDVIRGTYFELERYAPFIAFSIQQKHPEFQEEMLEDATLQEFMDAWNAVIACSGVKFVSGETGPVESTGASSTQESASLPAGHSLQ